MKLLFEDGHCEKIIQRTCAILSRDTTILACRKQFPIIPAYAVTLHRSEGLTLNNIDIFQVCSRLEATRNGVRGSIEMYFVYWTLCYTTVSVSAYARIFVEKLSALHKHPPDRVIEWIEDKIFDERILRRI